jgi:hypothetical protein
MDEKELEMYRQLEPVLLDLLDRVKDRLSEEHTVFARDLIEAHGEYGVALEMICDWLIEEDSPVNHDEYGLIAGSATAMEIFETTMKNRLAALRVVPNDG